MYLLKISRKEDETEKICIKNRYEYTEYEKLTDIVKFIYSNAIYIDTYEIFTMEKFENNIGESSAPSYGSTIVLGSRDSTANFR